MATGALGSRGVVEGVSPGKGDVDMSTADAGRSLKIAECGDRSSPLVNTALGLMGYQVPQVCDLMMKHWMDTVHLLLRHDSLTLPKLRGILDGVDTVLREVKGPRLLELIEAILKAAVHARNMKPRSSSDHWVFVRQKCSGSEGSDAAWAVEKILEFVVKEKEDVYRRLSPISRLHVWRLRPSLLKEDLSDLAKEFMQRPLLSVKVESHGWGALDSMVASLALAPDMLDEVRRLLLNWSRSVVSWI